MKIFSYIKYFLYLGINWNWSVAIYIIKQEIKGEKKYGINTTGADELKKMESAGIDISHATVYMPANYPLLETIFNFIPATDKKHFLDIGSGKGRALAVAAFNGYNKVTGIDFSKKLCMDAMLNLQLIKRQFTSFDFSIINKDATNVEIPADVDYIFLFNPFDVVIMSAVVFNIMESLHNYPRTLQIAYANPLYKDLFLDEGFEEVFYTKTKKFLELSILNFRH